MGIYVYHDVHSLSIDLLTNHGHHKYNALSVFFG